MAEYKFLRNTKFQTCLTYLILEEITQWLDDFLEIYVVRKSAYIVVGLDNCGFSTQSAFYNIGIDSSLCQKVYSTNLLCFFFKYTNELFTNNLTLALWFCNSCKLVIISLLRIDTDKVQVELTLVAKYSLYLITFIFTQ